MHLVEVQFTETILENVTQEPILGVSQLEIKVG